MVFKPIKRWEIAPRISSTAYKQLEAFHPVLRQILFNRGITSFEEAQEYLEARLPPGTEPENMLGIPAAVERIKWAIQNAEPIAIYGDYDTDGVTATALLTLRLSELGADVRGYIPNRFDEGYGLNNEALDNLRSAGIGLVVTVDCGIRSIAEAEHARQIGIDLIISDHHHPGETNPPAIAVINPRQPQDTYPEKELAGVGLAYKLASAIEVGSRLPIESYLDLVALGTVADLAPLTGENRALVRGGLEVLREPQRQGVYSLMMAAGLTPRNLNATHIGFSLGPRLNAAGRLDSALAALELLVTTTPEKAGSLAQQLDNQNRERQRITQEIQARAEQIALERDPDALLLFAADPDFNPGVVGLAASRLVDRYYRPAIVAFKGEQFTRGSCRSIPEFHITQALDMCADLLEHHGGHAAAAGFTVSNENLAELVERLQAIALEELASIDLRRTLKADVDIPLHQLKPDILHFLAWLEPTGQGNPRAVFVSRELQVRRARRVGKDEAHLKLDVTDGRITYPAIAFQFGPLLDDMPDAIDIIYHYELNEYNGRADMQLNIIDIKPSASPDN